MLFAELSTTMRRIGCFLGALALATMPARHAVAAEPVGLPLQLVADIALGGNATRLDYASFDAARHLLFIAHLGDSAIIVFDTRARKVVARISGVHKVHGVLALEQLGRVYASATGSHEVVVIDEASLQVTARMPGGVYPDGMAYAPNVRKLYVSDEHGNAQTVIDIDRNTRIATIALGGEVGNTQYDPASKHIFANVQTRNELVEIDPATDEVVGRTHLPGSRGNHGLLIEPLGRLAFVACEDNDRLLVLNLRTKKLLATFSTGKGPDVLAFDSARDLLYVASESGIVSLFRRQGDGVSKVGEGFVGPNAHVVAVDPLTHDVYFPLIDVNGRTTLRIMRTALQGI